MTIEEAREVLGDVRSYLASRASLENEMLAEHTFTDICNAIKALEQQLCEDCISREEMLKYQEYLHGKMPNEENYRLWEFIKNLPSVTPQQTRWIPVSKELPEENIHVLCQFYMGGMAECYHAHGAWHIVGGYRISCDEVVVWMPLPEPYRSENE